MTILSKLKAAFRWPWFIRPNPKAEWDRVIRSVEPEQHADYRAGFYAIPAKPLNRNERLAEIARDRADLMARRAKLRRQKKAFSWIDTRLQALTNEAMKLEGER